LDFNRIIGAEKVIKSLGLTVGIIINAFDDYSYKTSTGGNMVKEKVKAVNISERNRSALKNSTTYLKGYQKAGGKPDVWIFQRWMPYPDTTGPETNPETDMGLTKLLLEELK